MVEVSVYGNENPAAFDKLTEQICQIFNDVLGIAPDHIYVKYQAVSVTGVGMAVILGIFSCNVGIEMVE